MQTHENLRIDNPSDKGVPSLGALGSLVVPLHSPAVSLEATWYMVPQTSPAMD